MKRHTERIGNKVNIGRRILLLGAMFAAIVVAATCAVCFGVQSKQASVDEVESAQPLTSTTYSNITGTGYTLTLKAGDIINYTYSASATRYIRLPRGSYYLEVWGASGGKSTHATMTNNVGGYTKVKYVVSAAYKDVYIVTGGQGAGPGTTPSGGYNGGGSGGKSSSDSAGGGGATHMATASGLLSSLSSNKTAVLVVAGGGGGNGCSSWNGGKGGGGTTSGGTGSGGSNYAPGGNGGTFSGIAAQGSVTNVTTKPTFGLGGSSSSSSSYYGCGGGGGGYWGGWPGNNISGGGASGGGGSGFYNSSYTTLVSGTQGGATYGNGYAKITVISVNDPPVTKNYVIDSSAPKLRGGSVNASGAASGAASLNISVAASSLAADNDYANISGGKVTDVYFSKGLTTNYDTIWGANEGIYLDAACTKIATPYIRWTWTNNQTLNINSILKLPRKNVDGAEADNKLTLYTKMRDKYGSSTNRGVAVIKFYLQVRDNGITALPGVSTSSNIYRRSTYYKVGLSTNSSEVDRSKDYSISNNLIYNPKGTGIKTIFLPKPISPTDKTSYVINATDVYTDADTNYDKVAFKTATIDSDNSKYYSLTFNSGTGYAAGLYPSITLKATGARPVGAPYVTLTLTGQSSETASGAQVGAENKEVQLVFRISNTRPYFASSVNAQGKGLTEPSVEIAPGKSDTVNLKSFLFDPDDGEVSKLTATFATGALDLKIPAKEYVQVDMSNTAVALASNVSSNYYGRGGLAGDTATTGEGTLDTGFKTDLVAAYGSAAADDAQVLYRYVDSQTIEFIGKAATYNQYSNPSGRKGHFYVMVRVVDPSDPSDIGIWYPIAIKVTSSAPVEPTPYANFTLSFNEYRAGTAYVDSDETGTDASSSTSQSTLLTPLSFLNSKGELVGIGKESSSEVIQNDSGHANPFVVDSDGFMYTTSESGSQKFICDDTINDFVMLDGGEGAILDNGEKQTGTFFNVTTRKLYAARSVFARFTTEQLASMGVKVESDGAEGICSFYGLAVTPLRSTNGEYFQFRVKVVDTRGEKSTVSVCIKVENRAVSARRPEDVSGGTDYAINEMKNDNNVPYGKFKLNNSLAKYAVDYTIENNDVIQITPYDFAYDWDLDKNVKINPKNADSTYTFNSNPRDAGFIDAAGYILDEYTVAHTTLPASSEEEKKTEKVKAQQLTFANPESIISSTAQYAGYISTEVLSQTKVGKTTVNIPCIQITGIARTTSAIVQIRFAITDGFSSIDCLVTITARNSAPVLNNLANHPRPDADTSFRLSPYYSLSASGKPNEHQFTASQIAYDKDGDTPTFISGSAKIVAKDGDRYYEALTYANGKYSGVELGETDEERYNQIVLSDYAEARITKDRDGYDVVSVKALSSTQIFDKPIYLAFQVQDGFRAQPQTATLYLPIDIVNSNPQYITDDLEKTEKTDTSDEKYTWMIKYETATELKQPRYIANSKELCESTALNVPESNKTYLFDDADAQQHVIVNPAVWAGSSALVEKHRESRAIAAEDFEDGGLYQNAAVVYTPMYSAYDGDDNFVTVTIEFFYRDYRGVFTQITSGDTYEPDKQKCQYWAIKIVDNHTGTAVPMQLAIAVKDDHHDQYLYSVDPDTSDKVENTVQNKSRLSVVNFYYGYRDPGVRVMHTYYRTDGNAEATTEVDSVNHYNAVDYRGVTTDTFFADPSSDLALEYMRVDTSNERKQAILKSIQFTDSFKYLYFEKSYTNSAGSTALTYKHFASSFMYDPIIVNNGIGATIVPMSYIAMPKAITGSTETSASGEVKTHVAFGNASHLKRSTTNPTPGAGNDLFDNEYKEWGATDPKVLKNLKLSDGTNEWSGEKINDNPYIVINYVAGDKCVPDPYYVNDELFTINEDGVNTNTMNSFEFREDNYGFSFIKKPGGNRAPGLLKLTVAVKTLAGEDTTPSKVEYAEVEINLVNTRPQIKYLRQFASGLVNNDLKVKMTMGDTEGKSIKLNSKTTQGISSETSADEIAYNDADDGDALMFYLPSAMGTMTKEEYDHLLNLSRCSNMSGASSALPAFYNAGRTGADEFTGKTQIDAWEGKYTYNPNPDYEQFFSVSPESGSSSTLTFIPNSKTKPNISEDRLEEYLKDNYLKQDSGGVYYPFRILFFDSNNNSTFTEGYWSVAIVKVYIDNDPITVNSSALSAADNTYSSRVDATSDYDGLPRYNLSLSKGSSFFIDVSTLLSDNDIVLNGQKTFVTNKDTGTDPSWTKLTDNEKVRKDYLVMPEAYGYTNLGDLEDGGDGSASKDRDTSPVDIRRGTGLTYREDGTAEGLPYTTLVFEANSAFKDDIYIAYEFADSNGSKAILVFKISYSNDNPTPNTDTYSGSDVIDITMKTNDVIYVYASDSTLFNNDAKGGFPAYEGTRTGGKGVKGVTFPFGSATAQTAKEMSDNFGYYASTYYDDGKTGDALVLGSDDATSTLRIDFANISFTNGNDKNYVETKIYGDKYVYDKNTVESYPVCMSIKALGAINTILSVKLIDGSGATVDAKLRINVVSTAPTAKSVNLPEGLTYVEPNVYKMELAYGESLTMALGSYRNSKSGFMTDIDYLDADAFSVATNMDGSQFSYVNPTKVPVVNAEFDDNYLTISAIDFINDKKEPAEVKFRVSDPHGATSEVITIQVFIPPAKVVKASAKAYDINLMSYLDYSDLEGNANADIVVPLVEKTDAKIFKDVDADATSAAYDVELYALLYQDDAGAITATTYESDKFVKDNALIASIFLDSVGIIRADKGSGPVYDYVKEFYTVSISENGKELHFIPNSVTIKAGKEAPIPMYAVVSKRYKNGGNTTMDPVEAELNVKVANSKLQAAESNAYNHGYPHKEGDSDRESDFLEFTGTTGDSLTWNLYDLENYQHGLFYDYDMLKYKGKDGKETITYIDSKYEVSETGVKGKPSVLTVSSEGVGDKQTVTIRINRKVYSGIPPVTGIAPDNASTSIDVYIYATDAVNSNPRPSITDSDRVVAVKITVNVENDDPEISETVPVGKCPECGSTENIRQDTARTATCGKCNKTFKSLDPDLLGYSITYNDIDGYVLDARIEYTKSLTLLVGDIIDDADYGMDSYVLLSSNARDSLVSDSGEVAKTVKSGDISLFDVAVASGTNEYGSPSLTSITFTCTSTERGKVATCSIMIRDSVRGSAKDRLNIRLTVDNIAPVAKDGVSKTITIMGVGSSAKDDDALKATKTFSILDFITDANGDAYDPTLPENSKRSPHTYTYIDEVELFGIGGGINEPQLFGPNLYAEIEDAVEGGEMYYVTVENGCSVSYVDAYRQKFSITPYKGIYGEQTVSFTIFDSGNNDESASLTDLKSTTLTLKIVIANPLDDVPDTLETMELVYGVTRTLTVEDLLGEENATGYEISSMEEVGTKNLMIYKPGEQAQRGVMTSAAGDESSNWRIYAYTEDSSSNVKVNFRAGEVVRERTLPIRVVPNNPPQLLKKSYNYTTKMLDDPAKRTIKIKPTDWFVDMDAEDVMAFISPVKSSQSVKVEVTRVVDFSTDVNGEAYLLLKFNRRGESVITVNVNDLSGRSYQYDVTVNCTDAPEMSWWENFVSLIEANWMWFWIIVACILLFLILLILLIIIIHKKRKMRREIEALLESETELEEEMMRLSSQSAQYQSFGFLPPTAQSMRDPGLMLGGGAGAPASNSLQLNAGTGGPTVGTAQPTNSTIPNTAPRTGNAAQTPPTQQTPPSGDGFDPNDF